MRKIILGLMFSLLSTSVLAAIQANQCTFHLVNHTRGDLVDPSTGKIISSGNSIRFPINCRMISAKYEFGEHHYYNRSRNFFATTNRAGNNPNFVTVTVKDKI